MNSSESSLFTIAQKTVLVLTLGVSIGGPWATPGTSSAEPYHVWENHVDFPASSTSSGFGKVSLSEESTLTDYHVITMSQAISEMRRISGLTWEELGRLFRVSRRSVHFWASGQPMNSRNEKFLLKVLYFFRRVDRGSARNNRATLFQIFDDRTPFDLISEENFTEAERLLGQGTGRKVLPPSMIDRSEKILRSPLPPEQLVDAMNDRIHRSSGKGRAVRTTRTKQSEIE